MLVHLQQVHRENIRIVPNCIPGRESIDIEIFGMEGVPYEDLQRYLQEKEQGTVFKRSKIEQDPEEIRKQFAAFQAKKDDPSLAAQSSTPSNVDIVNQPIPMVSLPPMGFSGYILLIQNAFYSWDAIDARYALGYDTTYASTITGFRFN